MRPASVALEGADAAAAVVARARIAKVLAAAHGHDWLIADTPGNASALSRAGHEIADILVTPLNDSPVDIDVLARVDWERRTVEALRYFIRIGRLDPDDSRDGTWPVRSARGDERR